MSGRQVSWIGTAGASVTALALIPEFRPRPVPLPAARRAEFVAHLARIAAEGFSTPPPRSVPADRRAGEAPEPALVAACCTACGGWCCQGGAARNAYLGRKAVARWRADHPGAGPDAMIRDYLARLPALSAEQSCVYHGARGCTLPRRMRADLCNAFHCRGIRDLCGGRDGGER